MALLDLTLGGFELEVFDPRVLSLVPAEEGELHCFQLDWDCHHRRWWSLDRNEEDLDKERERGGGVERERGESSN